MLARRWGPQPGPQQGSGAKCLWAHGLVFGPPKEISSLVLKVPVLTVRDMVHLYFQCV